MAQLRLRHVLLVLPAAADLHREVPVFPLGLVRDDLDAVELEDGAGGALAGFGVVEGCHAFFNGDGAGAEGERVGYYEALLSGLAGGLEDGEIAAFVPFGIVVSGGLLDGFYGSSSGGIGAGEGEAGGEEGWGEGEGDLEDV